MNDDYKSALSKIHLNDIQKEQMKQLFKKKHMRRKNIIAKSIVAAAAAVALVLGTVGVGKMIGVGDADCFTLQVNAKEMGQEGDTNISDDYVYDVSISSPGENTIAYNTEFPISCKGENISTVTYSVKGGLFQITNPVNERIVINGQKPSKELWMPSAYNDMTKEKKELNQYTSFTVDYTKQKSEHTVITVGYNSKMYSPEKSWNIYSMYHSKAARTPEGLAEVYEEFYRDLDITCTVTFVDGKTATKKIVVSALPEENEYGDSDFTGDNGTVVTCYRVKK